MFGGDPEAGELIAVGLGAVEGDPEVEPSWRAWVSSAAGWCPILVTACRATQGRVLRGPERVITHTIVRDLFGL